MKGDFSRLTFDPAKQFTRVLMQQGRVQLDADWNEQTAILLHYLQTLAADLIGPFGGPGNDLGFGIKLVPASGSDPANLEIGPGRYYVDGLLCENRAAGVRYFGQPSLPRDPKKEPLPGFPFLAYLDVWERHVTYLVDDALREVALGGADTATRAQVVWQVRVVDRTADDKPIPRDSSADQLDALWKGWVSAWQPQDRGHLKARAKLDGDPTDPCLASPGASYRGAENQLYRVEIQEQERKDGQTTWLTFKWSRENGAVVYPVRELQGFVASLESLGRDEAGGLKRGDWVEIVDDDTEVGARSWSLLQVEEVKGLEVTLKPAADDASPTLPVYGEGDVAKKHVLLRRWDHRASAPPKNGPKPRGAVLFVFQQDAKPEDGWLTLEDGVQIQFQPGPYRPGDYWLIPARTATGDVEWPGTPQDPAAVPPHGVEHHFAPLALVKSAATTGLTDLRKKVTPLAVAI
jgi:uncharacterized protein DUF6519